MADVGVGQGGVDIGWGFTLPLGFDHLTPEGRRFAAQHGYSFDSQGQITSSTTAPVTDLARQTGSTGGYLSAARGDTSHPLMKIEKVGDRTYGIDPLTGEVKLLTDDSTLEYGKLGYQNQLSMQQLESKQAHDAQQRAMDREADLEKLAVGREARRDPQWTAPSAIRGERGEISVYDPNSGSFNIARQADPEEARIVGGDIHIPEGRTATIHYPNKGPVTVSGGPQRVQPNRQLPGSGLQQGGGGMSRSAGSQAGGRGDQTGGRQGGGVPLPSFPSPAGSSMGASLGGSDPNMEDWYQQNIGMRSPLVQQGTTGWPMDSLQHSSHYESNPWNAGALGSPWFSPGAPQGFSPPGVRPYFENPWGIPREEDRADYWRTANPSEWIA